MNIVCAYNYETIKDPRLREVTRVIRNSCECITEHSFAIAAMIAKVEDNDLLSNDDFVDICDYVKRCFGFEKTTAYNLLKIGREFIQTFEDGTIETVLTYTKKDYTISQVVKMLPLGVDRAKELTSDGVITSEMSCRQIERIVKANMKRMIVDDPEDQDDPEDFEDQEDHECQGGSEDREDYEDNGPLTEEDYKELRDRFGAYVEFVVRDMISGKGERWLKEND